MAIWKSGPFEDTDLRKFQDVVNRQVAALAEVTGTPTYWENVRFHARALEEWAAVPHKYVLGVNAGQIDPKTLKPGMLHIPDNVRLTHGNRCVVIPSPHQQKENTMIEKKNFVTPPVKTPAGSLAHRHLGSLVTITLSSGAEITDILTAIKVEQGERVNIHLASVVGGGEHTFERGHCLNPKSVVLVRRPKAVAKKPAARRR